MIARRRVRCWNSNELVSLAPTTAPTLYLLLSLRNSHDGVICSQIDGDNDPFPVVNRHTILLPISAFRHAHVFRREHDHSAAMRPYLAKCLCAHSYGKSVFSAVVLAQGVVIDCGGSEPYRSHRKVANSLQLTMP